LLALLESTHVGENLIKPFHSFLLPSMLTILLLSACIFDGDAVSPELLPPKYSEIIGCWFTTEYDEVFDEYLSSCNEVCFYQDSSFSFRGQYSYSDTTYDIYDRFESATTRDSVFEMVGIVSLKPPGHFGVGKKAWDVKGTFHNGHDSATDTLIQAYILREGDQLNGLYPYLNSYFKLNFFSNIPFSKTSEPGSCGAHFQLLDQDWKNE